MAEAMTPVQVAREKMLKLEEALLAKNPQLPHILRDIHEFMKVTPECVTLFREEPEMSATLIKALERQTNMELVAPTAKKPSTASATKKLAKASADDLGF